MAVLTDSRRSILDEPQTASLKQTRLPREACTTRNPCPVCLEQVRLLTERTAGHRQKTYDVTQSSAND